MTKSEKRDNVPRKICSNLSVERGPRLIEINEVVDEINLCRVDSNQVDEGALSFLKVKKRKRGRKGVLVEKDATSKRRELML